MNYADIKTIDIQDGIGVRVSIYVSGCHFHCKGCHNQEAWDFNYGKEFTQKEIDYIIDLLAPSYIAGLSILGGEPMELVNQQGLLPLVKKVKEMYPNKTIWCYTGYDFEKDLLGDMYKKYDYTKELLNNIDIIVDGQFIEEKKIVDLKFRGSINQRKVDVKASLKNNKIVTLEFGDEDRYEESKEVASDNSNVYKEFKLEENKEKVQEDISEDINSNIISFRVAEEQKPINNSEYIIEETIAAKSKGNKNKNQL